MSSREDEKRRRREERLARERAAERTATRRPRLVIAGVVVGLAAAAAAIAVAVGGGGGKKPSPSSPGSGPLLASTAGEANGQLVHGIQCQAGEQLVYHIHSHLAVYVNGSARAIPAGIGIPPPRLEEMTSAGPFVTGQRCLYWLHSHTADGIVHVESPTRRVYTLGDYFAIWNQPLGAGQVGPAKGAVTAYLNGRRFTGDPRNIPLTPHALIQLDVGAPAVAPVPFRFPAGL